MYLAFRKAVAHGSSRLIPCLRGKCPTWSKTQTQTLTYFSVSLTLQVEQEKQFTHQALLRAETTAKVKAPNKKKLKDYLNSDLYPNSNEARCENKHCRLATVGLQQLH